MRRALAENDFCEVAITRTRHFVVKARASGRAAKRDEEAVALGAAAGA